MSWRKNIKLVMNWITNFFIILLFIAFVLVTVSRLYGEQPSIFGYQIKTVLSGSMEPEFKTGSLIVVKMGGDMTRFEQGDVITYTTEEGTLITHRILEVNGNGQQYITKGDANDGKDLSPVIYENIVGEYTGLTVPYVGYVMNFANTREGAAILLILPGIFLLSYSIFTLGRVVKQVNQMANQEGISTD